MDTLVYALIWLLILEIFSYITFPAISYIAKGLTDRGFALSKLLGIIISAYLAWITSSLHIIPFTRVSVITLSLIILAVFLCLSYLKVKAREQIISRMIEEKIQEKHDGEERPLQTDEIAIHEQVAKETVITDKLFVKAKLFANKHFTYLSNRFIAEEEFSPAKEVHSMTKLIIIEEILFIGGFFLWVYLRGLNPTIMGTEKFMDFGIINAILKSPYMPPHDMWLSGFSLNYYYYGQYLFAFIIRLSGVPASFGYNFSIATIFCLSLTLTFSLVHTLSKKIYAGIISAFVLTSAGNLNFALSAVQFFLHNISLNGFSFWYPTSTRLIPYTINEYPIYSFIVSDLHAHFTDIPVVLTSLLLSVNIFFKRRFGKLDMLLSALIIGMMGVTNSWDALFYASVLFVVLLYLYTLKDKRIDFLNELDLKGKLLAFQKKVHNIRFASFSDALNNSLVEAFIAIGTTGIIAIILFFPFYLFFKAPVDGIGINTIAHSDPLIVTVLFGFFFFFILSYLVFLLFALFTKKTLHGSDILITYFVILGLILILLPESIYLKDIFYKANPAYFRANTVFKLYYQAWILFAIATGYIFSRINGLFHLKDLGKKIFALLTVWNCICAILFISIFAYTYEALDEAYLNVSSQIPGSAGITQSCMLGICVNNFKTDNGISYLKTDHLEDAQMIDWLNTNAQDNAIITEAVGDSYTYDARISVNTGLATLLGWPNHEYQWRNTYAYSAERTQAVFNLYNSGSVSDVKNLIEKYHISYIIVGIEERTKYPAINEAVLRQAGKIVFVAGSSYIIQTGL